MLPRSYQVEYTRKFTESLETWMDTLPASEIASGETPTDVLKTSLQSGRDFLLR